MEIPKMAEGKLIVEIQNKNPIELVDFTNSFYSISAEYHKFLSDNKIFKATKDSKLYVKEIRQGSIITELIDLAQPLAPLLIPFVENTIQIIEFAKYLNKGFNWLLGKEETRPQNITNTDIKNLSNIVAPIAHENGSNIIFTGDINNPTINVTYNYNTVEANAIQNAAAREIAQSKIPESNIWENVLFYWDTTKYESKSAAVDRGSIDSIYDKPLKVIIEDPELKNKMIDTEGNLYHLAFFVDVEVMTIQGIPHVYKVLKLRGTVDRPKL